MSDLPPNPRRPALGVMTRRPGAGKSRLAADVSRRTARDIYRTLLSDTLQATTRTVLHYGVSLDLYLVLDGANDPTPERLPGPARVIPQSQGGLGQRLASAFDELFAAGHDRVALVASDSAGLPTRYLVAALESHADIGLGPCADGGFYVISIGRDAWAATTSDLRSLLTSARLGTPRAFDDIEGGACVLGLTVQVLPMWFDVDLGEDLPLARRLLARRADGPQEAARDPARSGGLAEVYLHITNRCSGACPHCYLRGNEWDLDGTAGIGSRPELTAGDWIEVIRQAKDLGTEQVVVLGGDPFMHPGLLDLIGTATSDLHMRVRLFLHRLPDPRMAAVLARAGNGRVTTLVSLDDLPDHPRFRPAGHMQDALTAIRLLKDEGMPPIVNTVLFPPLLPHLAAFPPFLAAHGVDRWHLILPHARGGGAVQHTDPETLLNSVLSAAEAADREGVAIDNFSAWRARFAAPRDLCTAGVGILAVDPHGTVHACPITCGDAWFSAGSVQEEELESIWKRSPLLHLVRNWHARDRLSCRSCEVVDACGGECWVQAHYAARAAGRRAGYLAGFPYCELIRPILLGLREEKTKAPGTKAPRQALLTPFDCI